VTTEPAPSDGHDVQGHTLALLEVFLNTAIEMPFTALAALAFRNPEMQSDPKIRRAVAAQRTQDVWNGGASQVASDAPITGLPGERQAASTLRCAREAFGSALNFEYVDDETLGSASDLAVSAEAHDLGAVVMPMRDSSYIVYDAYTDRFSAWNSWADAGAALRARREDGEKSGHFKCVAKSVRLQLAQQHLSLENLDPRWAVDQGTQERIADETGVDQRMRPTFLRLAIWRMDDGSILLLDPDAGWRSAETDEHCTLMLSLKFAPNRLDRWIRKNLTY
jgi:hypothetical protein